MVDNISNRFSLVMNNSITNSKRYDNWLKDKFSLQAQLLGKSCASVAKDGGLSKTG
jgi:hypothetical protein